MTNITNEQHLDEVLAEYLKAVKVGQAPARHDLLAAHPELAVQLEEFLVDLDQVDRLAAPLRAITAAVMGPAPGESIGDYELLEEIARGGMGVVYKARQCSLNRTVALKMLGLGLLEDETSLQRFRAEAEAVARMDHPHIVPVYEVGDYGGRPYFTMKLIEREKAADKSAYAKRDQRRAAEQLVKIADAVHYAHQRGVLHRDLKPANILLDADGQPYVSDFGLAKRFSLADETADAVTQSGALIGTPSYMAPEQTMGTSAAVTVASDIYGLGAILYEMLTGRPPFRADNITETLRQLQEQEPARPRALDKNIDRDLETICLKCLEKDPVRRYDSARALADDVSRWLAGEPIQARPIGAAGRLWRWARRNPALSAVSLLALTALVLIAIGGVWFGVREAGHAAEQEKALGDVRRALGRAEENAKEAKRQQQRADERSRDAHDTLHRFSLRVNEELGRQLQLLPLRKKLLESALPYYRKFVKEQAGNPKLRRELAQAHAQVGVITNLLGSKSEALRHRQAAFDLYKELLREKPGDVDLKHSLLDVHLNLAAQLQTLARHQESMQVYEDALRQGKQFVQSHPKDQRFTATTMRGVHNLAVLYQGMRQSPKALPLFQQAIEYHMKRVAARPNDLAEQAVLAMALNNLGVVHATIGQRAEALQSFEQARDLRLKLVEAQPRDAGRQLALAASYRDIGAVQRELGKPAAGLIAWGKSRDIRERLALAHRDVTHYQTDLAGIYQDLAKAHRAHKQIAKSEEYYRKARAIWQKLAGSDPATPDYQDKLARCDYELGRLQSMLRKFADADRYLQDARDMFATLVQKYPSQLDYRHDLAKTLHAQGQILQLKRKFHEALPLVQKAVQQHSVAFAKSPRVEKYRLQFNLAYRTLQQLQVDTSQFDEAWTTVLKRQQLCKERAPLLYRLAWDVAFSPVLSIKTNSRADQWNDKAMEILHEAVAAGFRDKKRLQTEAAFRLLRKRVDFQELLKRMER